MKIAYFDCSMGISGNLILGALIDAGASLADLKKLKLNNYNLKIKKTSAGTQVEVQPKRKEKPRFLKDILKIIDQSSLKKEVKTKSKQIFKRLAAAEAQFHKLPLSRLHFHEVGSSDAIVDIVGSVIGILNLGIKEIYFPPLNLGSGKVKFSHGTYPLPAPATVNLTRGLKVYASEIKKELTTPTGAAIITTLGKQLETLPYLKLDKIGVGEGSYKLKEPDVLKVFIGDKVFIPGKESVYVMETEIDDLNPEFYDYVIKKLIKSSALDAYLTPIIMKKNRPGALLSVLCRSREIEKLAKIIFTETSTFGLRIYQGRRKILQRKLKKIKTRYGWIRVKIGYLNARAVTVSPEYADCKKIAEKSKLPLKAIYDAVKFTSQNYPLRPLHL